MARIYPQAVRNIIHLGEGDAVTSKALENIREIGEEILRMDWTQPLEGLKTPVDENALSAFIFLPWFNRVWFVQEIVLARNNTCVLAGDELDFNVVGLVVTYLFVNLSVTSFAAKFEGIVGGVAVSECSKPASGGPGGSHST